MTILPGFRKLVEALESLPQPIQEKAEQELTVQLNFRFSPICITYLNNPEAAHFVRRCMKIEKKFLSSYADQITGCYFDKNLQQSHKDAIKIALTGLRKIEKLLKGSIKILKGSTSISEPVRCHLLKRMQSIQEIYSRQIDPYETTLRNLFH